jgi:hypothetical protein
VTRTRLAAALAALTVIAALLSGCGGGPSAAGTSGVPTPSMLHSGGPDSLDASRPGLGTSGRDSGPRPEPIATRTGPLAGGPVRPPAHGALLGAYAEPEPITQPGRIEAVDTLQRRLGRPLAVVHTYRTWTDEFGTDSDRAFLASGATLLYSWNGTDTRAIAAGRYDRLIAARADAIRAMRRPILLEWRWEADRPNLRYLMHSGADYVAAWRHIRAVFAAHHVTNASWVWCPTADGFGPGGDARSFYPGDSQVDWLCVDAYPGPTVRPLSTVLAPFLRWAWHRDKPIIIGEYGVPKSYGSRTRAAWLRGATAEFTANPQIRAACYYDSDPDQPSERYALGDDPAALAAFTAMARDPYFDPHPAQRVPEHPAEVR